MRKKPAIRRRGGGGVQSGSKKQRNGLIAARNRSALGLPLGSNSIHVHLVVHSVHPVHLANGSRPEALRGVPREGLLDYVAMDIKAPMPIYDRLAGVRVSPTAIEESIRIIADSGVEHEFRTTAVEALLGKEAIQSARNLAPPGSPHRLQPFRPQHAFDPDLRSASPMPRDGQGGDRRDASTAFQSTMGPGLIKAALNSPTG